MKRQAIASIIAGIAIGAVAQTIVNGIPWYDQNGKPVSAHGANIVKDNGRYYMFGELKTDSATCLPVSAAIRAATFPTGNMKESHSSGKTAEGWVPEGSASDQKCSAVQRPENT